jgi:putative hydroxymethylpyrimidine transport system substrate-binding protein
MRWIVLAIVVLGVASCGGGGGGEGERRPTVVLSLDFVPNAVHAPIYMAARDGRDRAHGIHLDIRKPAAGPDRA